MSMSSKISAAGKVAYHLVDARGQVVGRLASQIAPILRGKHKPTFAPNVDCGDYIVVINAKDIVFTGEKWKKKVYFWHTQYPGGLKQRTAEDLLQKKPEEVLRTAVLGMLPRNKMRAKQAYKLRIFSGSEHTFQEELGDAKSIV